LTCIREKGQCSYRLVQFLDCVKPLSKSS
jgi:hypothetical protein